MILFRFDHGHRTHVLDETTQGNGREPGPAETLCRRPAFGGNLWEDERWPTCVLCARALRLRKKGYAGVVPLRTVSYPRVDERDFRCPVCGERMGLAAKRDSFPTQRVKAVRVSMLLVCNNDRGHRSGSGDSEDGVGGEA